MGTELCIPVELIKDIKRGDTIFFIGAGLSRQSGFPNWHELLKGIIPDLELSQDLDLTQVAQQFVESKAQGRNILINHLRDVLKDNKIEPNENHYLLFKKIPHKYIFTTNFDELIEITLRAPPSKLFNIINQDPSIGNWTESQLQLIKLHGSIDTPDSIVITKEDYDVYFKNHPALVNIIQSMLLTKSIFFIGYSFSDPEFNHIWNTIRSIQPTYRKPSYMVVKKTTKEEIRDKKQLGIEVLCLNAESDNDTNLALKKILLSLIDQLEGENKIEDKFIAPWALPKEEIPFHIKWKSGIEVNRIAIHLKEGLEISRIYNVESEFEKVNDIVYANLRETQRCCLSGVILYNKQYDTELTTEPFTVDFLFNSNIQFTAELSARITRPILKFKEDNIQILLLNDDVKDDDRVIPLELNHTGLGMTKIAIKTYSHGKILSSHKDILGDIVKGICGSKKAIFFEGNGIQDEKKVEVNLSETFADDMITELFRIIDAEEWQIYDIDETTAQALKELLEKTDVLQLKNTIIKYVQTYFMEYIIAMMLRHPTYHTEIIGGQTYTEINMSVEEIKIEINYKDTMDNLYGPIFKIITVQDKRKKPKIIQLPFDLKINTQLISRLP